MTDTRAEAGDGRLLASGNESGTAPGDRTFRPDVQGLRALAIALVVLFHAGVPGITGGFVGVDVFFVVSGFVITGLLLRERGATGRNSVLAFYGRRARRILPAATLVIILSVLATYHWLGFLTGNNTATDGRYASLFVVNFHFISEGTNYLASQLPPSPLQNYWSLSVEEQFYVVYPALFIGVAAVAWRRVSLAKRLAAVLTCGIVASFAWSIVQTSSNPTAAFFSPFTRAWELALGGLVAVGSSWFRRIPGRVAAAATWLGLAGILTSAFLYSAATPYPGSAVALPVLSTAALIAAGTAVPGLGVESVLGVRPLQWLGDISYSLYLWHFPLLIIPMEYAGHQLSVKDNLGWVALAVVLAYASYRLLENPLRHARRLRKSWRLSIGMGLLLIAISVALMSFEITTH